MSTNPPSLTHLAEATALGSPCDSLKAGHRFLSLTASAMGLTDSSPSVLAGTSFSLRSRHLIPSNLWELFLVSKEAKSAFPARHAKPSWVCLPFTARFAACLLLLTAHPSRLHWDLLFLRPAEEMLFHFSFQDQMKTMMAYLGFREARLLCIPYPLAPPTSPGFCNF